MAGSKSRSRKEKASAKNGKGQQKASVTASGSSDTVSCSTASAYNPISGTFHTLEIPLDASSLQLHDNGHLKNTDDTEEHSSTPHGTESEYDSVSNNGSCSGESQDSKDKAANPNHQETVPGLDNERREKIRLKNEKKHQRQKERRAQELHERCCGFLMSRKLESLAQQLVAMGFSYERATLALMANEGKLEASVNWLFEGNEEDARNKEAKPRSIDQLKLDISEQLAQISALELRYKCTRQEVERAVVACEGDLIKAKETLEAQKREPPANVSNPEVSNDANGLKIMQKKSMLPAPSSLQQKSNEMGADFPKTAVSLPMYSELGSGDLQFTHQAKALAERRWPIAGSSPTFSSSMAPHIQVSPPSTKLDFTLGMYGNEARNHQLVREPVVMMQRPQLMNTKQNQVPSFGALPSVTTGWLSSGLPAGSETMMSNGNLFQNPNTINYGLVNQQVPYNGSVDPAGLGGSWSTAGKSPLKNTPSLAARSSLGLFTSHGSSTHVDWSTGGSMPEFDYTSIDWSLDTNLTNPRQNGLWKGLSSLLNNNPSMRINSTGSSYIPGFQDGGATKEVPVAPGFPEWTSPFGRKDSFSLPGLFVTSPAP